MQIAKHVCAYRNCLWHVLSTVKSMVTKVWVEYGESERFFKKYGESGCVSIKYKHIQLIHLFYSKLKRTLHFDA